MFSLGRNWILGLLVFSAVLMILLGYRVTKPRKKSKKKRPYLSWLGALLVVMLLLIILGSLRVGYVRQADVVEGLTLDQLVIESEKGVEEPGVLVAKLTYTNSFFLPAVIPERHFVACWWDEDEEKVGFEHLEVQVDGESWVRDGDALLEVMPGATREREVRVGTRIFPARPAIPEEPEVVVPEQYAAYDAIILAAGRDSVDCNELLDEQDDVSLWLTIPVTE